MSVCHCTDPVVDRDEADYCSRCDRPISDNGHVTIVVPGVPIPLQRHRTGNGRTYLPTRSRRYREQVQAFWMAAGRPSLGDAPFNAAIRFYGANHRSDVDNLAKAVLDALNSLAYLDDSQLVSLGCCKLPADDAGARAELELWTANR